MGVRQNSLNSTRRPFYSFGRDYLRALLYIPVRESRKLDARAVRSKKGSLCDSMTGIFLFSLPRHFDLNFTSPSPLPLDSPRKAHQSNVMDLNIFQRGFVKVHSEAADNPRDGQIEFCVGHAKVGNVSRSVPFRLFSSFLQTTNGRIAYLIPRHCLLPFVKVTRYLLSATPSWAALIHRSGSKE